MRVSRLLVRWHICNRCLEVLLPLSSQLLLLVVISLAWVWWSLKTLRSLGSLRSVGLLRLLRWDNLSRIDISLKRVGRELWALRLKVIGPLLLWTPYVLSLPIQ